MAGQRYGLFGWPVKHSVSPLMQEAGLRALGVDGSYELLPTPPEALAAKVAELRREGFAGWNVTIPHKRAMMDLVDEVEPTARAVGSVNTVRNEDGFLRAWSTDGYGLEMSIRESFGVDLPGGRFLFWGTGGAARATCGHFAVNGAASVVLVNRTVAKAEALATQVRELAPACAVEVVPMADREAVRTALAAADVVIQGTSLGLHPDDPVAMPEDLLTPDLRLVDMIYRDTPLLQAARARGCATADGRGMLLWQGVRSLELWTGRKAPVAAMRKALEAALAERRR